MAAAGGRDDRPGLPVDVHVRRPDLSGGSLAACWDVLDPIERARADGYRRRRDRDRFVARRALLRAVLGDEIGVAPRHVTIATGARGKPVLAGDSDVRFSPSSSDDLVVVAVTRGLDVGVDVERSRALDDVDGIAALVCSPGELAALAALKPPRRSAALLACWTAKEACVKCDGGGLALAVRRLEVAPDAGRARVDAQIPMLRPAHEPACVRLFDRDGLERQWMLARPDVDGYVLAVAVAGTDHIPVVRMLRSPTSPSGDA